MRRTMILRGFGLLSLAISLSAHAQNYGAGSCSFPNTQMFSTIQSAVNAAPAGSVIAICPGVYAEQVTISKPLTLLGRNFGNKARAVVAVPPGTLTANVSQFSVPGYAQILVQNPNTPGPVNITGITVDGKGAVDANGLQLCTTGIFYSSGTSGTVNEVATRNQVGEYLDPNQVTLPCGFGIWAENSTTQSQGITIENSSVHHFGETGIATYGNADAAFSGAPVLIATIYANFITGNANEVAEASQLVIAIDSQAAKSDIFNNLVNFDISNEFLEGINGGGAPGNITISTNTIADVRNQFSPAIYVESGIAQSNRLSNTAIGIEPQGSTVTGNQIMNTGFAALVFQCSDQSAVSQNTLNDANMAFYDGPQAATTGNQLDNIDTIATAPNCQ